MGDAGVTPRRNPDNDGNALRSAIVGGVVAAIALTWFHTVIAVCPPPRPSPAGASCCPAPREETTMRPTKRALAALALAAALSLSAVPAFGNAPPPTNGGNGGGQSGQCTGDPDSRPASCGP
jgi:hypothetical protein